MEKNSSKETATNLLNEVGRRDEPAEPQSRQPKGFGQAPDADHLVVAPPEARCDRVGLPLSAAIDFIHENPRAHAVSCRHDGVHLGLGQDRPHRVVRIGDCAAHPAEPSRRSHAVADSASFAESQQACLQMLLGK